MNDTIDNNWQIILPESNVIQLRMVDRNIGFYSGRNEGGLDDYPDIYCPTLLIIVQKRIEENR